MDDATRAMDSVQDILDAHLIFATPGSYLPFDFPDSYEKLSCTCMSYFGLYRCVKLAFQGSLEGNL